MRFCLAIPHTPWIPERVVTLDRLKSQLADTGEMDTVPFRVLGGKAPNHVWSAEMWEWMAEQDVDWCVQLQDDALVAPDFFDRLSALIAAASVDGECPYPIIGLQVPHPMAPFLAQQWDVRGFTTSDGLVGVGYAVRIDTLKEFLNWRATALKEGALEHITEDTLLGMYAMVSGKHVYHPIPTIVDHDTAIPSSYGNDHHPMRKSLVRWDNDNAARTGLRVPHMGKFYTSTAPLAVEVLKAPPSPEQVRTWEKDDGRNEKRRLNYAMLAKGRAPKWSVLVMTPTRGSCAPEYAMTLARLIQDTNVDYESGFEIDMHVETADVVRVRNRMVQMFLRETEATHLLFLDDDIEVMPVCIYGMLRAEKGFVATPYPRRDGIDWERIRNFPGHLPAEAAAYTYSLHPLPEVPLIPSNVAKDGTIAMRSVPLGCALLERKFLQRMSDTCTRRYADRRRDGSVVITADLFGLAYTAPKEGEDVFPGLLSEDYSFCERVRAMGHTVHMYLGSGSPAVHHGTHAYRGTIEAFDMRRD